MRASLPGVVQSAAAAALAWWVAHSLLHHRRNGIGAERILGDSALNLVRATTDALNEHERLPAELLQACRGVVTALRRTLRGRAGADAPVRPA